MSVQLFHIPVKWEGSGTQSRFHTLLIRSQYAQEVPFALPYRLYSLARAPTLCVCFEPVQNKRQGLALQVAHGDPIALSETLIRFASRFYTLEHAVGAPS